MCIPRKAIVAFALLLVALVVGAFSEVTVTQQNMLTNASAQNATGTTIGSGFMARCRESAIYLKPTASITAGAIQVESADDPNYTGTWAAIGSALTLTAGTQTLVQVTGVHMALRTRISTGVTNGTVTTVFVCN